MLRCYTWHTKDKAAVHPNIIILYYYIDFSHNVLSFIGKLWWKIISAVFNIMIPFTSKIEDPIFLSHSLRIPVGLKSLFQSACMSMTKLHLSGGYRLRFEKGGWCVQNVFSEVQTWCLSAVKKRMISSRLIFLMPAQTNAGWDSSELLMVWTLSCVKH